MTPKETVETLRPFCRVFFKKSDGAIMGTATGGGGLEALTGEVLLMATFNDPDAGIKFGCLERFFHRLTGEKPLSVDLSNVEDAQDAVATFIGEEVRHNGRLMPHGKCPECDAARVNVVRTRDVSVTFAPARET